MQVASAPMDSMPPAHAKRRRWSLAASGLVTCALVLQVVFAYSTRDLGRRRVAMLGLGVILCLLWARARRPAGFLRAAVMAHGAALLLGLTAIEAFWLVNGAVFAEGFLGLLAAAGISATLLSWLATAGRRRPWWVRGMVASTLAFASTSTCLFLAERACSAVVPANLYAIIPDDPTSAGCLVTTPRGYRRATPGFRGRYIHPEFKGDRVDINSLGFRDGLDETAPPSGETKSIVVLGDSFVFGTGVQVEETFHELLESHAAEMGVDSLQVYGAGVPGHGPYQSALYLAEIIDETRPNVVVEAIYEGNDVQDTIRGFRLEKGDPVMEARSGKPAPRKTGKRATNGPLDDARPPMERFLDAIGTRDFWLGSSALLQYTYPSLEATLSRWGWVSPTIPVNRMLSLCLARKPPSRVSQGVSRMFTSLAEMEAICRRHGARLVILMIPGALQADPARFQEFLDSQRDHDGTRYDRTSFHDRLVVGLRDAGYLVVDPLHLLETATRAGEHVYHREGHFDVDGHRIVADALVPVLREVLAER